MILDDYFDYDIIKVQLLQPEAQIPTRANEYDAGFDLHAIVDAVIPPHTHTIISTLNSANPSDTI